MNSVRCAVNVLSEGKQVAVISALCEGVSIRATARLVGVDKDSVMALGVKVGNGCAALHGSLMRGLRVSRLELDEVWSYIRKKRRNVTEDDPEEYGDMYVFLGMDGTGKAIISWLVGKRNGRNAKQFVDDLRSRVVGEPEICTDGFPAYRAAINLAFENADYGIVDKQMVVVAGGPDDDHYYAREVLVKVDRQAISGSPRHISTSYIERANLTLRMSQRRFTRQSSGFSKKFENHCAAVSLFVMNYNFCRIHEALRITPAMQLNATDRVWSVSELIQAALSGKVQERVSRYKTHLRVIDGGKE